MAGVLATAWSALVARISSGRPGERTAPGGEGEEGAEGAEGAEGEQLEAPPPIKQEELEQQLQAASHPRTVALTLALTPTLPTLISALTFPNLSPYLLHTCCTVRRPHLRALTLTSALTSALNFSHAKPELYLPTEEAPLSFASPSPRTHLTPLSHPVQAALAEARQPRARTTARSSSPSPPRGAEARQCPSSVPVPPRGALS